MSPRHCTVASLGRKVSWARSWSVFSSHVFQPSAWLFVTASLIFSRLVSLTLLLSTPSARYVALGPTDSERAPAYRCMFDAALPTREVDDLRLATRQQKTWGSARFQQQIEALANRELAIRPRGRPKAGEICT